MIVPARQCHACNLAIRGLRVEDVEEIKAASGLTPEVALPMALNLSTKSWALVDGRNTVAMFGVAPWPHVPALGIPWMLCAPGLEKYQRELLCNTKRIVAEMGEGFQFLTNYTDVRHTNNLGWLEWAGFRFDKFIPEYGVEKRPFFRFSKEV